MFLCCFGNALPGEAAEFSREVREVQERVEKRDREEWLLVQQGRDPQTLAAKRKAEAFWAKHREFALEQARKNLEKDALGISIPWSGASELHYEHLRKLIRADFPGLRLHFIAHSDQLEITYKTVSWWDI